MFTLAEVTLDNNVGTSTNSLGGLTSVLNDGAGNASIAGSLTVGGTLVNPAGASTNRYGIASPSVLAETLPYWCFTLNAQPSSGWLTGAAMYLTAGQVLTGLAYAVVTAAVTPAHHWMCLLDLNSPMDLLAVSADKTTAAIPTNAAMKYNFASGPYTVPATGVYYACFNIVATTMPYLPLSGLAPEGVFSEVFPPSPINIGGAVATGLTVPGTPGTTTYPRLGGGTQWQPYHLWAF